MAEIDLLRVMLDTYGIPLTILFVVGVLHIKSQINAHKDRLQCAAEIKALNDLIDQNHKEQQHTIQTIRISYDNDINALLAMQKDERADWKQSISEITERLMKYLEGHNP